MSCGSGRNSGTACATRNTRVSSCRTPINVLSKLNKLQCGTSGESIYCRTGLTTFENIDWHFDQLFAGRSSVNTPCDVGCPKLKCCRKH